MSLTGTTEITGPTVAASSNSGCYLHAAKDLRPEARDLPAPAKNEVQIAVRSTTLCGSDVHYFQHFRNGSIQVLEPLCLGHESAGEIVSIGSEASEKRPELAIGDKVALECGIPCGQCHLCKNGRYNVCPNLRFRSSGSKFPHYQGTLQERVNHPAMWVHKLPSELSFEVGALLEPLAVSIHAVRRSQSAVLTGARDSALIFGAGAIGLLCALALQAVGTKDIIIADIDRGRLEFAKQYGFAQVIYQVEPKRGQTLEEKKDIARETVQKIGALKWDDGEGVGQVQRTLECTGVESCLQASIYATRNGGCVVLVGMGTPDHTLPISDVSAREISLIPTWRYANAYPRAIEIATASVKREEINGVKLAPLEKLVTHHYKGLDHVRTAFDNASKTRDADGKLIVKIAVSL
ncbi:hypothetical protein B7463_g3131, partial [Scytalidium lignicola]